MSAVAFDECVPKINIGVRDAFEKAGGVGEAGRKRDAEGEKFGNQEGVLLTAFVDDMRVHLLQASDGFTAS